MVAMPRARLVPTDQRHARGSDSCTPLQSPTGADDCGLFAPWRWPRADTAGSILPQWLNRAMSATSQWTLRSMLLLPMPRMNQTHYQSQIRRRSCHRQLRSSPFAPPPHWLPTMSSSPPLHLLQPRHLMSKWNLLLPICRHQLRLKNVVVVQSAVANARIASKVGMPAGV
jgi:hypothetical protein